MTSASAEPSSWAELVRSVDQSRKTLPWDPSATEPVQRVSLYHVSIILSIHKYGLRFIMLFSVDIEKA